MNITINDSCIPGTKLHKSDMEGASGNEFLKKVFLISDGVMLSQIRDISGIDGSTLQNWTKRGWVENSKCKKYDKDQLAHILIINMLRSCMQLEHISFLIHYINGRVDDRSDDIICDSELYGAICSCIDRLQEKDQCSKETIREVILEVIGDYREPCPGAKDRLTNALEIIIISYYASLMKQEADQLLARIEHN